VVQLAISEGLVWSVQELVQRLQANLAGAGEGGAAVAAADVPVRIRLLTVESLKTQISFQGDPFSRPRYLAEHWCGMHRQAGRQAGSSSTKARQCALCPGLMHRSAMSRNSKFQRSPTAGWPCAVLPTDAHVAL
jgi:hypothetical protein